MIILRFVRYYKYIFQFLVEEDGEVKGKLWMSVDRDKLYGYEIKRDMKPEDLGIKGFLEHHLKKGKGRYTTGNYDEFFVLEVT